MENVLVVLATFNGEKYIEEQIRSILNQVNVNVSILIYDDKSSDNTVNIIKNFSDSRITVVQNSVNSGSPAKNFLIALMNLESNLIDKYSYISLSDQDDIWMDSKLSEATKKMQIDNSSLYASNLIIWDEGKDSKHILKKDFKQTKFDFLFEGASAGCTYVFTSLFLLEFRKFASGINLEKWKFLSHDWLIYFCARSLNKSVIIDSNSYIFYRIHQSNVHGQLNRNSLNAIVKRFAFIIDGWYFIHSYYFSQFLKHGSVELYIYEMYNKNWFTRIWVVFRYNFKLIRSKRKFIQFALISFLPRVKSLSY
jgi:rhamnosyltransferase